jgi:hypothetical protein
MMRDIIFALALAKTWKECVDDINDNKISCNVDKGTYTITSNQKLSTSGSKGVNLTADAGVILDGTKELAGLTWNDCSDPKTNNPHYDQRCSPGVHVASVSAPVIQLFISDLTERSPLKREMLTPGRWPKPKPSATKPSDDAPPWWSVFDTTKAWSKVYKVEHAKDKKKNKGYGKLVDAGGDLDRTVTIETEAGMKSKKKLEMHGDGYLRDSGIDATDAVIVVNWGKQMTEQGIVTSHTGDTLEFGSIPCPTAKKAAISQLQR